MRSNDWPEYTLGEVCTVTDCLHKTAPSVEYETPYRMLRTANIRNGKIDVHSTKSVTRETYEKWSVRGYLKIGDVILTREAPMGEVGLIKNNDYKFFLGQRMLQLRANEEIITPEFLYYSLQGRNLQHQINMNEGTGSVVSNIRIPLLKKMKINIPPIETQNKITRILSNLDEKVDLNQKMINNLEELAQSLFKRWFIDFEFPNENDEPYRSSGGKMVESELGLIPESFCIKKAGNLGTFKNGVNYKRDTEGDSWFKVANVRNIVGGTFFFANKLDGISMDEKKAAPYLLEKGDTLIVRSASPGETVYIASQQGDLIYSGFVIRFRASEEILKPYMFFRFSHLKRNLDSFSTGTTLKNLNQQILKSLDILIPDNTTLDKFNKFCQSIFTTIQEKKIENKQLKRLRDTLLPKLLSGEIELIEETEVDDDVVVQ